MPARATPRVIFEDTAGADENCDSVVQFFFGYEMIKEDCKINSKMRTDFIFKKVLL